MITWDKQTKLATVKCPTRPCRSKPAIVIEAEDYTAACDELFRRGWSVWYYESVAICRECKEATAKEAGER